MPAECLNCSNWDAPLPDPSGRLNVICAHCHTVVRVVPSNAGYTAMRATLWKKRSGRRCRGGGRWSAGSYKLKYFSNSGRHPSGT